MWGPTIFVVILIVRLRKKKKLWLWKFLVLVSCRPSVDLHYEMSPSLFFRLIEQVAFGCEMSKCHGWIEACSFLYKWSIYNKGMFHKSVSWLNLFKWSSNVGGSESAQGVLFWKLMSFHCLTSCLTCSTPCRMTRLSSASVKNKLLREKMFLGCCWNVPWTQSIVYHGHDRHSQSCCCRNTTQTFVGAHDSY